jgi:hypothetical protein
MDMDIMSIVTDTISSKIVNGVIVSVETTHINSVQDDTWNRWRHNQTGHHNQ